MRALAHFWHTARLESPLHPGPGALKLLLLWLCSYRCCSGRLCHLGVFVPAWHIVPAWHNVAGDPAAVCSLLVTGQGTAHHSIDRGSASLRPEWGVHSSPCITEVSGKLKFLLVCTF